MTNKNKGSMLSYFIQGEKYKVFLEINKRYFLVSFKVALYSIENDSLLLKKFSKLSFSQAKKDILATKISSSSLTFSIQIKDTIRSILTSKDISPDLNVTLDFVFSDKNSINLSNFENIKEDLEVKGNIYSQNSSIYIKGKGIFGINSSCLTKIQEIDSNFFDLIKK